jgi:hypothetical protein
VRSRGAESYIRLAKEIIAHYFGEAEGAGEVAAAEPPAVEAPAQEVAVPEAAAAPGSAAAEAPGAEEGEARAVDDMEKTA